MSGKYTSGIKPGGGDGKETRDAQDDAAIRGYMAQLVDQFGAMLNIMSAGASPNHEYAKTDVPGSHDRREYSASAAPGAAHPGVTANDEVAAFPHQAQPQQGPYENPFGPGGPDLKAGYRPTPPEPNPSKPPDGRKVDDSNDQSSGKKSGVDYTSRIDEIIRLLGKSGATLTAVAASTNAASTGPGSSSTSTTTDDGSGNVTTTTTKAPGPPSPGQFSHPIGRSEFGPDFDYGTRAYPWTNVASKWEAVGRFAANSIPGARAASGAFVQSVMDYDSMMRPSRDRNPYAILKGRNALDERIGQARSDLESHQNTQLSPNATDQEKAEHQDALKKKQTVLDALEAHKQSRAESIKWAESATEQMSGTAVGKLAAKVGKALGGGEELGVAGAASAVSLFKGAAVAAPLAILQFEKAAIQWAASGRQDGLHQIASLHQYGMAAPIAGDLARFGVARMMRDIQVGYDTAESSRRLVDYGIEVENRARKSDAANVRMANSWATLRYSMADTFNQARSPLDDAFKYAFDGLGGDEFVKTLGSSITSAFLMPLSTLGEMLRKMGLAPETPKSGVMDNPILNWTSRLAEPPLAPPIPDIP